MSTLVLPRMRAPINAKPPITPLRQMIVAAQWCGAVPLLLGTVILLVWWRMDINTLPLLGALNMLLGIALFGGGLGLLYGAYRLAGRQWLPGMSLALGLLVGNFPVAVVYGATAAWIGEHRLHASVCIDRAGDGTDEPTGLADARRPSCSD